MGFWGVTDESMGTKMSFGEDFLQAILFCAGKKGYYEERMFWQQQKFWGICGTSVVLHNLTLKIHI